MWRLVDKETQRALGVTKAKLKGDKEFVIEVPVGVKIPEKVEEVEGTKKKKEEVKAEEKKPYVFIRDFNVWISTDAENEAEADQVSFNGVEHRPFDKDDIYLSPDSKCTVCWQFVPKVERKVH